LNWAFRTGTDNPELQVEVIYFLMAKIFGYTPVQVNELGYERVLNFLNLESEWRKKEQEDSKRH